MPPIFPTSTLPTDSDIQAFVTNAGILLPSGYSFAGIAALAYKVWEEATGRTPFLASGTPFSQSYDPPGGKPGNLSSWNVYGGSRTLPVMPGIVTVSSVTINGQAQVFGTNYRLLPLNANSKSRPYDIVEFLTPCYGPQSSVVIVADFGYFDTIDADAWFGIVKLGASLVAKDIREGIVSSPNLIQAGEDKIQQNNVQALGLGWESQAMRSAQYYQFRAVGL